MEKIKTKITEDTFVCNSVVLAKYMVAYANEKGYVINMTKLQKLLYIAYGTYLAVVGARLVNEHPRAWPYGPVFPIVRKKLLEVRLEELTLDETDKPNDEVQLCVKLVFDGFGKRDHSFLSSWSRLPGSPWDQTVNKYKFDWGDVIPDDIIRSYFKSIIRMKGENDEQGKTE